MEPAHVLSISPVDPFWAGGLPAKRYGDLIAASVVQASHPREFLRSFEARTRCLERAVRGIRNELPIKRGPLFDAGAEAAHQPIEHERKASAYD